MVTGAGLVLGVSEFVDYLNQTLEIAYPFVEVEGELVNFKVSKNKWVYFDLKDETASLHCFGTIYVLPGPLEDGMVVRVAGSPRLHPLYNFSFNIQSITPVGEGAIRRAANLLAAKLEVEGLFDPDRKRPLPYPPKRIALITAGDSAAYADFVKIATARWGGLQIAHYNVLVQGEQSPGQIVSALKQANEAADLPEVIVLIRGGGSADDLATFSDERVVRAVASSRVPTLVAIGHEIDISLAELAADVRASTPSNAAELLLPDKKEELRRLVRLRRELNDSLVGSVEQRREVLRQIRARLDESLSQAYDTVAQRLVMVGDLLAAYDPTRPLQQGYALVRDVSGMVLTKAASLQLGAIVKLQFADGEANAEVKTIKKGK
jgi:exodeoxyribonuclease VII large subunit